MQTKTSSSTLIDPTYHQNKLERTDVAPLQLGIGGAICRYRTIPVHPSAQQSSEFPYALHRALARSAWLALYFKDENSVERYVNLLSDRPDFARQAMRLPFGWSTPIEELGGFAASERIKDLTDDLKLLEESAARSVSSPEITPLAGSAQRPLAAIQRTQTLVQDFATTVADHTSRVTESPRPGMYLLRHTIPAIKEVLPVGDKETAWPVRVHESIGALKTDLDAFIRVAQRASAFTDQFLAEAEQAAANSWRTAQLPKRNSAA